MPCFKTHLLTGVAAGVAYGGVAYFYNVPIQESCLASGLVVAASLSADLDTKSIPLRELASFLGACAAILTTLHFSAVWGIVAYFVVRFCISFFRHLTVHRGIFHSVLMALFFAEIGYYLSRNILLASAIFLGYNVHLILDEITGSRKAFKLFGRNWLANLGLMSIMGFLAYVLLEGKSNVST